MPDLPDQKWDPGLFGETENETELQEPKMYKVILHNDHYTTMDFVVDVLVKVFHKPAFEATKIMLDVHRQGRGICGVYTYDIAVTKVHRVKTMATMRDFPLRCTIEEE
ncbi:MAG: ATP-dependent Clp protease adapter ClpS [Syntrophaceae bacterium]|nr:ATP-dependent Clp protease adapter ClpS [Syntrophaceae bacterium]